MYRKILVRMPNWIGDAVVAMPAVAFLRRRFPDAELCALAIPGISQLLSHHPDLDRIIVFDRKGKHAGIRGWIRLLRLLRAERFDLCVLFSNAFASALLAYLAAIPTRLGYRRDGRGFLLNRAIAVSSKKIHVTEYYLRLVKELDREVDSSTSLLSTLHSSRSMNFYPPTLWLLPKERESASRVLSSESLNPAPGRLKGSPNDSDRLGWGPPALDFVGLNPGAAYGSSKRWEPSRFAEVADRLVISHGVRIVIFGGPQDQKVAEEIAFAMKHPPLLLAGRTALRESMALISRCRMLITNDSGPMHIAAAFGVPLVAVFGPTDPEVTSPVGQGHRLVRIGVDCSPCRYRECPIDHRCMVRLTPDAVYQAAAELLSSPVQQGAPVVFLDRDGTINYDSGYVNHPDKLKLLPGAAEAIRKVNQAGMKAIVVTNQSGIGRGYFGQEDLIDIHDRLTSLLEREGARLDGIYFCPHSPEERSCNCRKPAPGMLLRAVQDFAWHHPIDLSLSYVIGDKEADLLLAREGGAKPILVRTGYGMETEKGLSALGFHAIPVVEGLLEGVNLILNDVANSKGGRGPGTGGRGIQTRFSLTPGPRPPSPIPSPPTPVLPEPHRILILKPSSLGDIIHALPFLHVLRERFPKAHISWLVKEEWTPLLNNHPELDEILSVPFRLWGINKLLRSVQQDFDCVIDLQGLLRSGLLSGLSGAQIRIGFSDAREGGRLFYTHTVPIPKGPLHAVDRYLLTGQLFGIESSLPSFIFPDFSTADEELSELVRHCQIPSDRPWVAMHTSARENPKRWPPERFAALADILVRDCHAAVLFIGSKADRDKVDGVAARMTQAAYKLAGHTGLLSLAALLSRVSLLVCNDSGPMHLAAAVGTRVVALFGPTDPKKVGPYGEGHQVLKGAVDCTPCTRSRCVQDGACLQAISVERAAHAITSLLEVQAKNR